MKLFKILTLLCFNVTLAQTVYESMESESLGTSMELKIQLPRNYEDNS